MLLGGELTLFVLKRLSADWPAGAGSGVGGLVSALTASSTTVGSAVTLALLALASTNKAHQGFIRFKERLSIIEEVVK